MSCGVRVGSGEWGVGLDFFLDKIFHFYVCFFSFLFFTLLVF